MVAFGATACERVAVATFTPRSDPAFTFHYLTRDGTDGYSSSASPGRFDVQAGVANGGRNTRLLVYPPAQPMSDDAQSCATWKSQVGYHVQQGLALRIRHDVEGGRWRAVTVMKNVVWGANWQFNVLTWDSNEPQPWTMWGSVNLAPVFWPDQQLAALPWRVCARVEGDLVRIKGWDATKAEPGWDDPIHTGAVRIPIEWVYPGKAGWYVGHLGPAEAAEFTELTLDRLEISTAPR